MDMIKYGYLVAPTKNSRRGVVTVVVNRPGKDNPDQVHTASFAFCSPKDSFRKDRGRQIALSRLKLGKLTVNFVHTGTLSQAVEKAIIEVASQHHVPNWLNRALSKKTIRFGLRN